MHYQLTWKNGDKTEGFSTDCPDMAEAMMRATTDFPAMPDAIRQGFESRFGQVRGSFEQLLKDQATKPPHVDGIKTEIPGLVIRVHN